MKLMDMRILNDDPQVLASLISYAIEVGRQNNAPIVRLWADSPDADRYSPEEIPDTVARGEESPCIKVSESLERDVDTASIYSCIINPPRGIDH